MGEPLKLVAPPTPAEEAKQECLDLLEKLTTKVRDGEIETLVVITDRADKYWMDFVAGRLTSRMQMIGQLEYVKTKWLHKFMREAEEF